MDSVACVQTPRQYRVRLGVYFGIRKCNSRNKRINFNNNIVERKLRTDDYEKPSFVLDTDRWNNHDKTDNTDLYKKSAVVKIGQAGEARQCSK